MRAVSIKREKPSKVAWLSEELFRLAFAQASVGMAITDPKGRFVRANKAYSALTGYSESELRSRDLCCITHPDDLLKVKQPTAKLRRGEIDSFVIQQRYIKRTGGTVWVQNTISAIHGVDGKAVIMSPIRRTVHTLTSFAKVRGTTITYPAEVAPNNSKKSASRHSVSRRSEHLIHTRT